MQLPGRNLAGTDGALEVVRDLAGTDGVLDVVRDPALEIEHTQTGGRVHTSVHIQPIFQLKDDTSGGDGGKNEYLERGRPVPDFKLRRPSMTVDHVADLCICLHSRLQHTAAVTHDVCSGKRRNSQACNCHRFNPVASKASTHAYHRGQKVKRRRLADLLPGDRVLAGWAAVHGKIRLTDERQGALVASVVARRNHLPDAEANRQSWFERALVITTDLGETIPQAGGTPVLTLDA